MKQQSAFTQELAALFATRKSQLVSEYNREDTFLHLFVSVRHSTCFRRFFFLLPGAQNCKYSVKYLSDQYCYLLKVWSGQQQVAETA
jgi:hypothetical protein